MNNNPRQVIGFGAAVSVVIGSVIGSGIFMKPATMAAQLASPVWLIAVWIIAGAIFLSGCTYLFGNRCHDSPRPAASMFIFVTCMAILWHFFMDGQDLQLSIRLPYAAIAFVCAAYSDYFLHLPRLIARHWKQAWYGIFPYLGKSYIPWQIWVLNPSRSFWYWE